jgi:hypothetical protein
VSALISLEENFAFRLRVIARSRSDNQFDFGASNSVEMACQAPESSRCLYTNLTLSISFADSTTSTSVILGGWEVSKLF